MEGIEGRKDMPRRAMRNSFWQCGKVSERKARGGGRNRKNVCERKTTFFLDMDKTGYRKGKLWYNKTIRSFFKKEGFRCGMGGIHA